MFYIVKFAKKKTPRFYHNPIFSFVFEVMLKVILANSVIYLECLISFLYARTYKKITTNKCYYIVFIYTFKNKFMIRAIKLLCRPFCIALYSAAVLVITFLLNNFSTEFCVYMVTLTQMPYHST